MKPPLNSLNTEQKTAIQTEGNILCLNGAGSGETCTTVIAIANKLDQGMIKSQSLL